MAVEEFVADTEIGNRVHYKWYVTFFCKVTITICATSLSTTLFFLVCHSQIIGTIQAT